MQNIPSFGIFVINNNYGELLSEMRTVSRLLSSQKTPLYDPKGKLRKFTYTTVPDPATEAQQKTDIANLYKTVNVNNDPLTFDGKIKFD